MSTIDLTPFGFTPTESNAYSGLLDAGPSSGYSLAQVLGIARANAYHALRGLVGKGAAVITERDPQVFRAIQPSALLAQIIAEQEGKLDVLEHQVASRTVEGARATTQFSGERELFAIALRTVTRSPGPVTCIAPPKLLSTLLPIWRKRTADRTETHLWIIGDPSTDFPVAVDGTVAEQRVISYFGDLAVIVIEDACVSIGVGQGGDLNGIWSSDATIAGAARAAVAALTLPT